MKTFTAIARLLTSRMRVRLWRRFRDVTAAGTGPWGRRLPMSLAFRRPASPAKSERVVVRLSAAPTSPAAAPIHITHTHQHSHWSFHQRVRPLLRQSVRVHAPSGPVTSITAGVPPTTAQPSVPPLGLRTRPAFSRPAVTEPGPRTATQPIVTPHERLTSRLARRAAVTAGFGAAPDGPLPPAGFLIRHLQFADVPYRLEPTESRGEFGRPPLLVHRLQPPQPETAGTQAEASLVTEFPSRPSAPLVWRRVQPATTPEAEARTIGEAETRAGQSSAVRGGASTTSTTLSAAAVAAPPSRPMTFEGPALERLAEDVMRRIDRRLRIERERRGM